MSLIHLLIHSTKSFFGIYDVPRNCAACGGFWSEFDVATSLKELPAEWREGHGPEGRSLGGT